MLCQGAVFELRDSIFFTQEDQEIHTKGFPTDEFRALLRVADKGVATAVFSGDFARVKLRNVIIDGNRPELGIANGGLIEWVGRPRTRSSSG